MVATAPDSNSFWKISFNEELATYDNNTSVTLRHIKSYKFLGIYYTLTYDDFRRERCNYCKSPLTEHTEGNKFKIFCSFKYNSNQQKININILLFFSEL